MHQGLTASLLFLGYIILSHGLVVVEFARQLDARRLDAEKLNVERLALRSFPCTQLAWMPHSVLCDFAQVADAKRRVAMYQWLNQRKKTIYTVRTHPLSSRTVKNTYSQVFNDPLFSRQWYLFNRKTPGHDLNVAPVWENGIRGKGVVISLIDDGTDFMRVVYLAGVDYEHSDLKDAFRKDLSYDFNSGKLLPVPDPSLKDHHGTRCAGQLVSKPNNGICGVGICPEAQISAIRILSMAVSSINEAAAVVHKYHENHIYSCSWGPADDGKAIDAPDALVLRSFIDGLLNGRNGKGSIYVFAAGNGKSVDNCNYDGYANGIFALTVGAIDVNHKTPRYMEPCSAQLVTAYSSNEDYKIATTDLGGNRCTLKHGGTSAAAPMVTGILALALSVNPNLTWRDLRYICVQTAIPFSTKDSSWIRNGAGRLYSYKFGFGKVDAHKIVEAAKTWKGVEKMTVRAMPRIVCNLAISNPQEAVKEFSIDERVIRSASLVNISNLEQVTVTLNIKHSSRGDLTILLKSPSGTVIPIATRRPLDTSSKGLRDWTMMTLAFWGEPIQGVWSLTVKNSPKTSGTGILENFRISFWGSLSKSVVESKEAFAEAFLRNYYPPNMEYFEDKAGIWDLKRELDNDQMEKSQNIATLLAVSATMLLLLVAALLIARKCVLARKNRFAPIPSVFNHREREDTMYNMETLPTGPNLKLMSKNQD